MPELDNTPEEKASKFIEYLRKQREAEAERLKIFNLIQNSEGHDRHNCSCFGCMWYWKTVTGFRDGRFYKRFLNVKQSMQEQGMHEYMRYYLIYLRKIHLCNDKPIWMAYPHNKQIVYREM